MSVVVIDPLRLELSNFVGPLPLVKHVLAHYLQLAKEAHESRPGNWSRRELYNTTADDLLALYGETNLPYNAVVSAKSSIVQ
jgi:hypothetical protein